MIEIIPAIDIIDGKCVRLSQGDYEQKKVYNEDPLEVAKEMEDHGIRRVHLVDLDGAKSGRLINYMILKKITSRTSLIIDIGGGLKSDIDLEIAFDNGAQMAVGGSIAIENPAIFQRWIDQFGGNRILLGADCREGLISIHGWIEDTKQEVIPYILQWRKQGIQEVICTDIEKDGMLEGPNIDLYKRIREQDPSGHLIASGGVSCLDDIEALEKVSVSGVIIGKAIYEGKISLKDLLQFM
ncbi:MAG: 1-(5-phosphoribosyl)-5-[(5-phosphoribosylamino)methylideneamino]imidazole-4-carboxamide isomerase [Candidatus Azobacteroides sp.]|nr:1-(5-phosphoribosyl)-5-[(5-phosphoribosylamino)methylideneamino]imidazole-4-carboxamide isomerase [Candidatus Azobacteroides sp.]